MCSIATTLLLLSKCVNLFTVVSKYDAGNDKRFVDTGALMGWTAPAIADSVILKNWEKNKKEVVIMLCLIGVYYTKYILILLVMKVVVRSYSDIT